MAHLPAKNWTEKPVCVRCHSIPRGRNRALLAKAKTSRDEDRGSRNTQTLTVRVLSAGFADLLFSSVCAPLDPLKLYLPHPALSSKKFGLVPKNEGEYLIVSFIKSRRQCQFYVYKRIEHDLR